MSEHHGRLANHHIIQMLLMENARAAGSFEIFGLTCFLRGGSVIHHLTASILTSSYNNVVLHSPESKRSSIPPTPPNSPNATATPRVKVSTRRGSALEKPFSRTCRSIAITSLCGLLRDTTSSTRDMSELQVKHRTDESSPFGHQGVLFESAIEHNGTEERRSTWLPFW